MTKENSEFTGDNIGIRFYQGQILALEKKQKGLCTISYDFITLQEEIELARLKWRQLSRRVDLKPLWKPKTG